MLNNPKRLKNKSDVLLHKEMMLTEKIA